MELKVLTSSVETAILIDREVGMYVNAPLTDLPSSI